MRAALSTVASIPIPVTIGGVTYPLYAMRPYDDGLYERWYQERAIAGMIARGVPPVEAQRLGMSLRGDDPGVQESRTTIQGTLYLMWLSLRTGAITPDGMAQTIADTELLATIAAYNRINSGPPGQPANPSQGGRPPAVAKRITSALRSLFNRAFRSTRSPK